MFRWLIGIILGEIICKSSNGQHIQRLKITILGANWQLFRLERIAKCSYFILSTQNIKFYWFVMKIKKFLLPVWWYNRGSFPLGNKQLGSSFWMGKQGYQNQQMDTKVLKQRSSPFDRMLVPNAQYFYGWLICLVSIDGASKSPDFMKVWRILPILPRCFSIPGETRPRDSHAGLI